MAVREESTTSVDRNVVWLVVLGVIVLGLAGWIVFDLFFSATTAPNGEIAQVLADYETAWETGDAALFAEVTSEDYVFVSGGSETSAVMMGFTIGALDGFSIETIGHRVWAGDGPTYQVTMAETVYPDSAILPDGLDGISTIELVEDGDSYLVVNHVWFGPSG